MSLPSQERWGVQPYEHHGGVGPLPGTSSETSVAKLPDERKGASTSEGRSGSAASAGSQESARRAIAGIANLGTQVRRVDPQEPVAARKVPEGDDQEPEAGAKVRGSSCENMGIEILSSLSTVRADSECSRILEVQGGCGGGREGG